MKVLVTGATGFAGRKTERGQTYKRVEIIDAFKEGLALLKKRYSEKTSLIE